MSHLFEVVCKIANWYDTKLRADGQYSLRRIVLRMQDRKRQKMYYRVAIQVDASSTWQWRSTVLSTLSTLFQFLRLYRALPQDHLRVFSSSSREGMAEQLVQENNGLESNSVTAEQFLHERMMGSREAVWGASERREQGTLAKQGATSIAIATNPSPDESGRGAPILFESGMSSLERRRVELERGEGGDHDSPYTFTLPVYMPQILAWMKLLVRVQNGELQP
jgi:hypothetical protein